MKLSIAVALSAAHIFFSVCEVFAVLEIIKHNMKKKNSYFLTFAIPDKILKTKINNCFLKHPLKFLL